MKTELIWHDAVTEQPEQKYFETDDTDYVHHLSNVVLGIGRPFFETRHDAPPSYFLVVWCGHIWFSAVDNETTIEVISWAALPSVDSISAVLNPEPAGKEGEP